MPVTISIFQLIVLLGTSGYFSVIVRAVKDISLCLNTQRTNYPGNTVNLYIDTGKQLTEQSRKIYDHLLTPVPGVRQISIG